MNTTDFRTQTLESIETETNDSSIEDRLAELTGFDTDLDSTEEPSEITTSSKKTSSLLSDEELEEQLTRHSFANSPLSKLVFVAGAMFVVVFIASLFFSQFQSNDKTISGSSASKPDKQSSHLLTSQPQDEDKEKSELLSELALREQKERLKALDERKLQQVQPVKTQPTTQNNSVRSTPISQVQPQAITQTNPQTYPVRYQPSVRYFPSIRPSSPLIVQATQTDPAQSWKQLSQLGSFGGNSFQTGLGRNNSDFPSLPNQSKSISSLIATQTPQTPDVSNDPQAILFGQSVSGVLQNTIAWEANLAFITSNSQSDEQYLVVLNQPLKDKFGKEQIPAGSKIIVRLDSKTTALATLVPLSVVVNGVATSLPPGVLKIRGPSGQPLIAETRTVGGGGGGNPNTLPDVLSIAGDIANIPVTRSLGSLYDLFGGNSYQRFGGNGTNVFFLKEGTPLEVFVNKSFSLNSSTSEASTEKPLELNLPNTQQEVKQ